MEQHPIPQNISSYQFRLVGDMTLKQFFQLAGGAVISIVIYALPIHPVIKWPFIIFFSLLGVALAFLPFQERPLEQWIIAFFRSVYSPTVFRWKEAPEELYFQREVAQAPKVEVEAPKPTNANIPFVNSLEETESKFLGKLALLFNSAPVPAAAPAGVAPAPTPAPPPVTSNITSVESNPLNTPSMYKAEETSATTPTPPQHREVNIPAMGGVSVPKMVVEEAVQPAVAPSKPLTAVNVGQILSGQAPVASHTAQFSVDAAPPSPPTIPNTVSGQVIDPDGKFIEGAILEIRDAQGLPVRALRSNKVGHFLTVTPLLNGKYELVTEKEGFIFEPYLINITGGIIPPMAVRAKGRNVTTQVVN